MNQTTQQLKAYGYLPAVGLNNLADSSATHRAALIDSDVLAGRVCGCPDMPDEEIANANQGDVAKALAMEMPDALALQVAHRRMLQATGRGSWPAGCHMELYPHADRHAVTYHVRRRTCNRNYLRKTTRDEITHLIGAGVWPWSVEEALDKWAGKPLLDVALEVVREAYRRIGVWLIEMPEERGHDILLLCRPIPGSTIGIGWFPDGTCTDVVESHYDSSWQPSLYRLCLLLAHELGHNHLLQHTFSGQNRHRGVMSYNWPSNFYGFLEGDEDILPRDPSWGPLTRFFGGEPIPLEPGQLPPGPTPGITLPPHTLHGEVIDGRIAFRGVINFKDELTIPAGTNLIVWPTGPDGQYELRTEPRG